MNKTDLIEKISTAAQINKSQASTTVETMIDTVVRALKKGDRVTLSGFGSFSTYQRKTRSGRNPQTGELMKIAGRRVAKFTPGVELRSAVDRKPAASSRQRAQRQQLAS